MSTTGYDWWSKELNPVNREPGESGYFSAPSDTLDPRLFNGDRIRPEVRHWLLRTLYDYWGGKFHDSKSWSTVWLAGSGVSYQWAAGRGNGDLDVLIGVDFDKFYTANDQYHDFPEDDMADIFNVGFHAELWPQTATTEINDTGSPISGGMGANRFEVTWYVNPNSTDIRDINPYAAYDVSGDQWTVRPPKVPQNPASAFPQPFWDAANDERRRANEIIDRYNQVAGQVKSLTVHSPGWHNAVRQAEIFTSQAKALFDDIHLGRKQAFGPGGSGYGDYYNFRWQFHKKGGTVQALDAVAKSAERAREQQDIGLYGAPIDGAEVALRRAVMQHRSLQ